MFALLFTPAAVPSELVPLLAKIAAAFFFIGLPIIRAIRDARRRAAQQDGPVADPERAERERAAREQWKRMLRGEEGEQRGELPSVPQSLPPPPAPVPPLKAPAEREPVSRKWTAPRPAPESEESLEETSPEAAQGDVRTRPIASLPPITSLPPDTSLSEDELESDTERDEDRLAESEIARRERDERRRQAQIVRAEREASSPQRGDVAPVAVEVFDAQAPASAPASSARVDELLFGTATAAERRTRWRRAIIQSEVLGTPLALRPPSVPAAAPGVRG